MEALMTLCVPYVMSVMYPGPWGRRQRKAPYQAKKLMSSLDSSVDLRPDHHHDSGPGILKKENRRVRTALGWMKRSPAGI